MMKLEMGYGKSFIRCDSIEPAGGEAWLEVLPGPSSGRSEERSVYRDHPGCGEVVAPSDLEKAVLAGKAFLKGREKRAS